MNTTFTHTGTYVVETCYKCGIHFGLPEDFYKEVQDDTGKTFYCPNGHGQHYTEDKVAQLERELDLERAEHGIAEGLLQHANRSRAALRGQVTKIKRRIGNGVCPCCQRSFQDLKRHMEGQHPNWREES